MRVYNVSNKNARTAYTLSSTPRRALQGCLCCRSDSIEFSFTTLKNGAVFCAGNGKEVHQ